jgi:hypothetical protein
MYYKIHNRIKMSSERNIQDLYEMGMHDSAKRQTSLNKIAEKIDIINESISQNRNAFNPLKDEYKIWYHKYLDISDEISKAEYLLRSKNDHNCLLVNDIKSLEGKIEFMNKNFSSLRNSYIDQSREKFLLLDIELNIDNYTHPELTKIQNSIDILKRKLEFYKKEIKDRNELVIKLEHNKKFQDSLQTKALNFSNQINLLEKEHTLLSFQLKKLTTLKDELEIIPLYYKYASENGIEYVNFVNMIKQCNIYHQEKLLSIYKITQSHGNLYFGRWCKEDEEKCGGWSLKNPRCDCGIYTYKVDSTEFDPYCIKNFNIKSNVPVYRKIDL